MLLLRPQTSLPQLLLQRCSSSPCSKRDDGRCFLLKCTTQAFNELPVMIKDNSFSVTDEHSATCAYTVGDSCGAG